MAKYKLIYQPDKNARHELNAPYIFETKDADEFRKAVQEAKDNGFAILYQTKLSKKAK